MNMKRKEFKDLLWKATSAVSENNGPKDIMGAQLALMEAFPSKRAFYARSSVERSKTMEAFDGKHVEGLKTAAEAFRIDGNIKEIGFSDMIRGHWPNVASVLRDLVGWYTPIDLELSTLMEALQKEERLWVVIRADGDRIAAPFAVPTVYAALQHDTLGKLIKDSGGLRFACDPRDKCEHRGRSLDDRCPEHGFITWAWMFKNGMVK